MMSSDDRNYLEGKFDNVYDKIDGNQRCTIEKIEKTREILTNTIKDEINNHNSNPCKNIVEHNDKEHRNQLSLWQLGKLIIIGGALVGAMVGIIEIAKAVINHGR